MSSTRSMRKSVLSIAMGVYSVLVGLMFAIAFGLVGESVRVQGWRVAWEQIGVALLIGFMPLAWLLVRSTPESVGVAPDGEEEQGEERGEGAEEADHGQSFPRSRIVTVCPSTRIVPSCAIRPRVRVTISRTVPIRAAIS